MREFKMCRIKLQIILVESGPFEWEHVLIIGLRIQFARVFAQWLFALISRHAKSVLYMHALLYIH